MFESITKKRKNPVYNIAGWGLLVLVCVIFMFVGYSPDVDFMGSASTVAQVNGEVISYSQFSRYFERVQESRGANKMSTQERLKLNKEVVDSLVNRALIIQDAKKQGVIVGAEEIRDYLKQIPQFQEKGTFSVLKYKELIRAQGMSEAAFEEQIVEDLLVQKMNNFYMLGASDNQLIDDQEEAISKLKMNIGFIKKAKKDLVSESELSAQEIEAFSKSNEAAISEYYSKNQNSEFTTPEGVRAQHILIKVTPTFPEDKALAKIKSIAADLNPKNFGEMAKKHSEDSGSKERNGDLGVFSRGRMVPEFEAVAFELAPGKISEPFKTSFGYHIVMVNEKVDKKVVPLAEVKTKIATQLLREQKAATAAKEIQEALDKKQLDSLLSKKGWTWEETGAFGVGDMIIPKIGENTELITAAMSLKSPQSVYEKVLEKDGFYYIVKLKEMNLSAADKNTSMMSNNEIFKQIFQQQKSYEMFQGWMDQLRKTASIQINEKVISQN